MSTKKAVIKLGVPNPKNRSKAMQLASKSAGVSSVAITGNDKDRLEVVGEGVDAVCLVYCLRKKVCSADILVVEEVKDKKKQEEEKKKKEEEAKKKKADEEIKKFCAACPPPPPYSCYYRPMPMVVCEEQPTGCHIM